MKEMSLQSGAGDEPFVDLAQGNRHSAFDIKAIDMSNSMSHSEACSTAEDSMATRNAPITDKALALTRRIVALEARELTLQKEIGSKQRELSAIQLEKEQVQHEFSVLMGEPLKTGGSKHVAKPTNASTEAPANPGKKKHGGRNPAKKALGNNGWIHEVYSYMKQHPGIELSPETIALGLGSPEKNGLTSTCLRRLLKGEKISRAGRARFVYEEPKE
jgi:hypothetical protein